MYTSLSVVLHGDAPCQAHVEGRSASQCVGQEGALVLELVPDRSFHHCNSIVCQQGDLVSSIRVLWPHSRHGPMSSAASKNSSAG